MGIAPAGAHVDPPTLTAQHAFVGDPLWDLDTSASDLLTVLPDERTAIASTTKIMTLHLTVEALLDGDVFLDDEVTVSALAAGIGGSNMSDVNGVLLEAGEVVSLETLIRGMMYPSGNNAAWAIAEYIANETTACGSPQPCVDAFVDDMNAHVAAEDLVDTQFQNPNGFDAVDGGGNLTHYSTARELAQLWHHAAADSYFLEVTGFSGTYSDTTTAPSGTKTYMWNWGFGYPGWEGAKGGGTTLCNGPNNGCMIMSAERIGRRVVVSFMQGQPWTEEPGLFDYAYATIFHPGFAAAGPSLGVIKDKAVACSGNDRAYTATHAHGETLDLGVWNVDVSGAALGLLDEATLPGPGIPPNPKGQGPETDVGLATFFGGDVVTALRKAAMVDLQWWDVSPAGQATLVVDDVKMGPATEFDLLSIGPDLLLTAAVQPDGNLTLKTWRLDPTGDLVELDALRDGTREFTQVAVASPLHTDAFNNHRAMVATRTADGKLIHQVLGVDAGSGILTELGTLVESNNAQLLDIAGVPVDTVFEGELFPPIYYATAFRSGGNFATRFYRVTPEGAPVVEGSTGNTGIAIEDARVASLGAYGMLAALQESDGTASLRVWEVRRDIDNDIAPDQVARHDAATVTALDLCRVGSTDAAGDYVLAAEHEATGEVQLRAYRSGELPP